MEKSSLNSCQNLFFCVSHVIQVFDDTGVIKSFYNYRMGVVTMFYHVYFHTPLTSTSNYIRFFKYLCAFKVLSYSCLFGWGNYWFPLFFVSSMFSTFVLLGPSLSLYVSLHRDQLMFCGISGHLFLDSGHCGDLCAFAVHWRIGGSKRFRWILEQYDIAIG